MKKFHYLFLVFLLITAIYIWSSLFAQQNSNLLEVTFFDVGQGDSIFVEFQNKQILIDGGPNSMVLEKLGAEMDFFDRHLDLVILTHPDADHLTGLIDVLKYFEVGLILSSSFEKDTAGYQKWIALIKEKQIPLKIAQKGQKIELGQGIAMNILWPSQIGDKQSKQANNYSVVIQLVYNQAEFLLTGDIEKSIELTLTNLDIESDVLKIAHHGSGGSTNPLFLKKVNPKIAVISVGKNSYGHPSQEILDRLDEILVFRTDLDQNIKILTDGLKLWVE